VIEKIASNGLLDTIVKAVENRISLTIHTDFLGSRIGETAPDEGCFVEKIALQPRLIVLGWTSDQDPLLKMAAGMGWRCHRIVKTPEMLLDVPSIAGEHVTWCKAQDLKTEFCPDDATAFLIMSHHMSTDFNYLKEVLSINYAYIGMLGSQRRKQRLLHSLGEQGMLDQPSIQKGLERFYAPAGLDLGGNHPTTIALSIISEIQAAFSQRDMTQINTLKNR